MRWQKRSEWYSLCIRFAHVRMFQSSKTGITFWDGLPKSNEKQQRYMLFFFLYSSYSVLFSRHHIFALTSSHQLFYACKHFSTYRQFSIFFSRVCCCHLVVAVVVFVAHPTFVSFIYAKHYIWLAKCLAQMLFFFLSVFTTLLKRWTDDAMRYAWDIQT